jgi:hypothetical protein
MMQNVDVQRNSRIVATFSSAPNRRHAIRISISRGAHTTIGADFKSLAVGCITRGLAEEHTGTYL